MSELPAREKAAVYAEVIERGYGDIGIRPSAADIDVPRILRAYAEGRLVDRDAIDYEAAEIAYSNCETSKGVVDAALGGQDE